MLVNDVRKATQSMLKKLNRGFIDPDSYNSAIFYVQNKIIRELFDEYNKHRVRAARGYLPVNYFNKLKNIKASLSKIYKTSDLILDNVNNIFLFPDDFGTEDILMWGNKPVTEIGISDYADMANIELLRNDDGEFIKYLKDEDGIITEPMLTQGNIDTTPLEMFYFRLPVKPIWGYTVDSSGDPIFDENSSVDFDLSQEYFEEIVRETLIYLGVEVKDFSTVQIMQTEEQIQNKDSNIIQ